MTTSKENSKYRFLEQDHLHQIFIGGEWKNLTGTTTILETLSKPLTYWASGKAVEKLGWTNEFTKDDEGRRVKVPVEQRLTHLKPFWAKIMQLDEVGVLKLLDEAYKAHATNLKETASDGTDLHASLECVVKIMMTGAKVTGWESNKKVIDFVKWAEKNVKRFIGSEFNVYHEGLFIGGICDCLAEMKDGLIALIDFKSSKDAFFSQFVQAALYDIQISQNGGFDGNGKQIFKPITNISKYIIFPFGAKELKPCENKEIQSLIEAARACVTLYRQKSAFEK